MLPGIENNTEMELLGRAVYSAQVLEFALYGIASHASHIDVAKKDKHFSELNPEQFLRGNIKKQKATLGRIYRVFGDSFLIKSRDLERLIDDRNLIVHNYARIFLMRIGGVKRRTDGVIFLQDFIDRASYFTRVIKGLLYHLMEEAAEKEGRSNEFALTQEMEDAMMVYRSHVATHLSERRRT